MACGYFSVIYGAKKREQAHTWKEKSSSFCTRLSHLCVSSSVSASILAPASGLLSSAIVSCPASDSWSRVLLFFSMSSFNIYTWRQNVKGSTSPGSTGFKCSGAHWKTVSASLTANCRTLVFISAGSLKLPVWTSLKASSFAANHSLNRLWGWEGNMRGGQWIQSLNKQTSNSKVTKIQDWIKLTDWIAFKTTECSQSGRMESMCWM